MTKSLTLWPIGNCQVSALVDEAARESLVAKVRDEADELRNRPVQEDTGPPVTDDSVRARFATDNPVPRPPFWGARELAVDLDEVYAYLDRHVLFKLHWGGRGKKGEDWRRIVEGYDGDEGFAPKLERMWRERTLLPRANQFLDERLTAEDRLLTWTNEGLSIEGVLTIPPAEVAKPPYPLVVFPHGGPHGRTQLTMNMTAHLFAA